MYSNPSIHGEFINATFLKGESESEHQGYFTRYSVQIRCLVMLKRSFLLYLWPILILSYTKVKVIVVSLVLGLCVVLLP